MSGICNMKHYNKIIRVWLKRSAFGGSYQIKRITNAVVIQGTGWDTKGNPVERDMVVTDWLSKKEADALSKQGNIEVTVTQ